MHRVYSPAAIVCATPAAVAVVCSHNHANAPMVAAGLAVTGAALAILHQRGVAKRVGSAP